VTFGVYGCVRIRVGYGEQMSGMVICGGHVSVGGIRDDRSTTGDRRLLGIMSGAGGAAASHFA